MQPRSALTFMTAVWAFLPFTASGNLSVCYMTSWWYNIDRWPMISPSYEKTLTFSEKSFGFRAHFCCAWVLLRFQRAFSKGSLGLRRLKISLTFRWRWIFHVGKNPAPEVSLYPPTLTDLPPPPHGEVKRQKRSIKYQNIIPPVNNTSQLSRSPPLCVSRSLQSVCTFCVCVCVFLFLLCHRCPLSFLSQPSGVEKVGTLLCLPLLPVLCLDAQPPP